MKIRCLIIDDKPLALDILEDYIAKIPFLTLILRTENPIEGLEWVQNGSVDLVFLDIQMPELTGIQFMKIIKGKCKVILTTAYSEYALDGYEFDVIDYLMKPIPFERFYKAALKAKEILDVPEMTSTPSVPKEFGMSKHAIFSPKNEEEATDFIFVKTEHKIQNIPLNSIFFVESMQNYVAFHTENGRILSLQNLRTLEEKLPSPRFIRVHKSYIVAVSKIESVERSRIFIKKQTIPIGDTYRDAFFEILKI
jgi:two-component system, LytTR family, response regulator